MLVIGGVQPDVTIPNPQPVPGGVHTHWPGEPGVQIPGGAGGAGVGCTGGASGFTINTAARTPIMC